VTGRPHYGHEATREIIPADDTSRIVTAQGGRDDGQAFDARHSR
jgi:hypothetical protein